MLAINDIFDCTINVIEGCLNLLLGVVNKILGFLDCFLLSALNSQLIVVKA